ncbi:hypothetical protein CDAR_405151 [Caerostris darwini]|uniref:Uncharacterized protein n=1 Tax=Caerostris darwini TaxID=1538125 RepID=A0AAV4U777_9ARAC|nr:hypothetical protein CDAR_405151 [Caerostris darwini]
MHCRIKGREIIHLTLEKFRITAILNTDCITAIIQSLSPDDNELTIVKEAVWLFSHTTPSLPVAYRDVIRHIDKHSAVPQVIAAHIGQIPSEGVPTGSHGRL